LYQSTDRQKFATLFYGILDTENHQLCFSNAGHNRPILFTQNNEPQSLEEAGIVLSFMENFDFDEGNINLNPHDLLLIYSDGISEAMDHKYEEFGEERLALLVDEHKSKTAQDVINIVINEVKNHAKNRPQMDDMTLVVIKRTDS
jgi:sigma-B regulation protein RsbU (phosphoserine phosphatase)